jgi:hypothetical protein
MIKDREVVMVNAATMALEYKENHPRIWDDDAVAFVMKNLETTSKLKIYGIAAANEILKLRSAEGFKSLTNKQLLQQFVDNIYAFIAKMDSGQ